MASAVNISTLKLDLLHLWTNLALIISPPSNINWGNLAMGVMEENWEMKATVKQCYDPRKKAAKSQLLGQNC
jgi:hypothetical protein